MIRNRIYENVHQAATKYFNSGLLKDSHLKKTLLAVIPQSCAILALAVALSLTVNHFRKDGLPLIGDWSPKARLSTLNTVEEATVSLEEARALFLTEGAVFIDARAPDEYLSGHIRGAFNVPADNFDEFYPRVEPQITSDSLIIAYCDGEACPLASDLAFTLAAKGYSHVRVLVNGWSSWQDAKLPVESGDR
jgi:rhodanese-related sulfurtransferase